MGINGGFPYKKGENIMEFLWNFVGNTVDNLYLCPIKIYPHDSQPTKFIH